MMKPFAYTIKKPMTAARKSVSPEKMPPSSCDSASSMETKSTWMDMVLNA